jgi:hypothetical protein
VIVSVPNAVNREQYVLNNILGTVEIPVLPARHSAQDWQYILQELRISVLVSILRPRHHFRPASVERVNLAAIPLAGAFTYDP